MNAKYFDVIVAKDYVTKNDGVETKKTAWNKVGRAWLSMSGENLSLEMFHLPNTRYVVQLKVKSTLDAENKKTSTEQTPF